MADALRRKALDAYRAGHYAAAQAATREWVAAAPRSPEAHRLMGQVAFRLKDFPHAASSFEEAEQLGAGAECAFNAGNAWQAGGDPARALDAWQRAWNADPRVTTAGMPLARALAKRGDLDAAVRVYRAIAQSGEHAFDAVQAIVDLAAGDRDSPSPPLPMPVQGANPVPSLISIVTCSIDRAKLAAFTRMIGERFAGVDHELIAITDAKSLCEGLGRGLVQSHGDAVVFCHDDIEILAEDAAQRVALHLTSHDLVGVAGTVRVTGPAVFWAGHPWIHGWMTHRLPGEADYEPSFSSLEGPVVAGVAALDGVFLACRRVVAEAIGFDAVTFDGFHLYDLDFSYRAFRAGNRLAVACDLGIVHASKGRFDANWQRYADRFLVKFPDVSGVRGAPHFYAKRVPAARDVLAVQRRMYRLLAETRPG